MRNTSTLREITNRLNNFSNHSFYEMRESRKYDEGNREYNQLKRILKELTTDELIQIKSETTLSTEMMDRYFKDFFQDLKEEKPVSIRSKVFKAAWYYIRKGIYENMSQALKAAWKAIKIKVAMLTGTVTLKFRKTTGEIRTALATLKFDTPYTPKTAAKYTPDVLKFYDKSVEGWRSARIERILAA
jgi:hypothetical protein